MQPFLFVFLSFERKYCAPKYPMATTQEFVVPCEKNRLPLNSSFHSFCFFFLTGISEIHYYILNFTLFSFFTIHYIEKSTNRSWKKSEPTGCFSNGWAPSWEVQK